MVGLLSTLFALTALASPPDAAPPPAGLSARVTLEDSDGVLHFAGQPHSADGQLELEVKDLVSAPQALSGDAGRMHLRIETDYNVVEIDVAQPGFAAGTPKPAEPIAGGVKLGSAEDGTLESVELWGLGVVRLNGAVATSTARVMARVDAEDGTGLRVVVVGLPGRIFPGGSIAARFAHVEILGGRPGADGGVAAEEAPTRIKTPWGQAWVEPETPEEGAAPPAPAIPPRQQGDGGHSL